MDESKALLGLPTEFELAGKKVKVYTPNVEWIIGTIGHLGRLTEVINRLQSGRNPIIVAIPLLKHLFQTVKIPGKFFMWQKLLWYRNLNSVQQAAFLEQWREAIDFEGIKESFRRAGAGIMKSTGISNTP